MNKYFVSQVLASFLPPRQQRIVGHRRQPGFLQLGAQLADHLFE
jgi:hypothetical protein